MLLAGDCLMFVVVCCLLPRVFVDVDGGCLLFDVVVCCYLCCLLMVGVMCCRCSCCCMRKLLFLGVVELCYIMS